MAIFPWRLHKIILYSADPAKLLAFLTEVLEMSYQEESILLFGQIYVEIKAKAEGEKQVGQEEWEFLMEKPQELKEIYYRWAFYQHRLQSIAQIPGEIPDKHTLTISDPDSRLWHFTYDPLLLGKQNPHFFGFEDEAKVAQS